MHISFVNDNDIHIRHLLFYFLCRFCWHIPKDFGWKSELSWTLFEKVSTQNWKLSYKLLLFPFKMEMKVRELRG
jgi:hypothetical protein